MVENLRCHYEFVRPVADNELAQTMLHRRR